MCFERNGDYPKDNSTNISENIRLIGKESPIEILRRTPKTKEQITAIIEEKIAKLPPKNRGDKL